MGFGIFCGLVFCGLIYLYTQTKDRWNWGKLKKIILWIVLIPIILGLIWGGVNYLIEKNENRPKILTEFKNVKLGEDFSDVVFRLGKPTRREAKLVEWSLKKLNETKITDPQYVTVLKEYNKTEEELDKVNKSSSTDGDYDFGENLSVEFKNHKVNFIYFLCPEFNYEKLNGIGCGDTSENIKEKFGSDNIRVLCGLKPDEDTKGMFRAYDVIKYGTRYYLSTNSVLAVGLTDSKSLESKFGINWGKCE